MHAESDNFENPEGWMGSISPCATCAQEKKASPETESRLSTTTREALNISRPDLKAAEKKKSAVHQRFRTKSHGAHISVPAVMLFGFLRNGTVLPRKSWTGVWVVNLPEKSQKPISHRYCDTLFHVACLDTMLPVYILLSTLDILVNTLGQIWTLQ